MKRLDDVSIADYVVGLIFLGTTILFLGLKEPIPAVFTGVAAVLFLGHELRKLL